MFARFALGTLLLVGTLGSAATAPKVYAVSWSQVEGSSERRALTEQIDRQLRDELRRRGATVVDVNAAGSAILLKPRLEIFPRALELNVWACAALIRSCWAPSRCARRGRVGRRSSRRW